MKQKPAHSALSLPLILSVLIAGITAGCASDPAANPPKAADYQSKFNQAMKDKRKDLLACYHDARKADPSVSGTITVEYYVEGKGKVVDARVSRGRTTIQNQNFETCVLSIVRGVSFPSHEGGPEKVFYPLVFHHEKKSP